MNALERKTPPVLVVLCCGLLMWLTPAWPDLPIPTLAMRLGGAVLLAGIGLGICVVGVAAFRKAKTTVNPVQAHNASSLVRHGIYRYTRNPMYLGMLLVLAGWAAFLANPGALVFLPLFVGFMNRFQIQPEERILASLFGVEYASYLAQVRRWL